jgi:hypothetical protein
MRNFTFVLTLGAALALGGCGRGGGAPPAPRPLGAVPIEARVLYDNGGGIRDSMQVAIRDAATLRDIWQRATSTQSSPPPVPDVDFERQMLLLVASGRMRPEDEIHVDSLGTRREITAAGREQEVLAVQYTITEGCGRFPRDAYPLEIVRVRRYDGEIRFIGKRERASNCR